MFKGIFIAVGFILTIISSGYVFASINITDWKDNGLTQWEAKEFSGNSLYKVMQYKDKTSLQALSDNSASGLVLTQKIDLLDNPYLNWSWLIEKKLTGLNEREKAGDDFVARIYVVIEGGFLVWKTKSLNYVWSSNQPKGQSWNNPFAPSNVKMMSVRGNESETGKWYQEKRNVYQDLIDIFGDKGSDKENQKSYQYIDVIAIMTDSDNSGKNAESYYGDIIFTQQ
tara:strand:+ start:2940 stop:3617 length:678 start_codon:yes stop_codon:yes gene_type:complete